MTTSYHLTLVCVNTQEELAIDVEQTSALCAQRVAEDLYEGYRVVRIVRNENALLDAPSDLSEGALGDF